MHKLTTTLFLCLITVNSIYSQDNNQYKGEWFGFAAIGFATTVLDEYKTNSTVQYAVVGKEFIFNDNTAINVGVDFLKSNSDIEATHLTNNFIGIPVNYRLFRKYSNGIDLYAEFGLYGMHLINSKIEGVGLKEKESGLGFNFGYQATIGGKFELSEIVSFSMGLKIRDDFAQNYKDDVQETKIKNLYGLVIGVGVNL